MKFDKKKRRDNQVKPSETVRLTFTDSFVSIHSGKIHKWLMAKVVVDNPSFKHLFEASFAAKKESK